MSAKSEIIRIAVLGGPGNGKTGKISTQKNTQISQELSSDTMYCQHYAQTKIPNNVDFSYLSLESDPVIDIITSKDIDCFLFNPINYT